MIGINNLSKYFGSTPVLTDISLEILDGEKVGIVGKNGSGKTTLFKILSDKLDFDSGNFKISGTVGIIDQMPVFSDETTVEDVLKSAFSEVSELKQKASIIEGEMASGDNSNINEYSKTLEKIELLGGYNYEFEIDKVCNGLDISSSMRQKLFNILSGGEKTRVNLARIILEKTDTLLLDEPTNHLDLNATIWLSNYLAKYKGTVVTISHDRYFLDQIVDRIIELSDHKTKEYLGNYSEYAVTKEIEDKRQEEQHKRDAEALKKAQDASRKMHQWGTERMHKRAASMDKRIAKMTVADRPKKEKKIGVTFVNTDYQTEELLKVRSICKSYDSRQILKDLSFEIKNGDKLAIIGDNGTGKTTFLKILLSKEQADSGSIKKGVGLKMGYLPQIVHFENPHRNLIDTLIYEKNLTTQTSRNRLGAFKFSADDQFKIVEKLSGGEKSRLRLCTLMYDNINLLILDEPTNHLDIISREWIEEALEEYDGNLIFVSHDRYFISRFANKILELTRDGYYLFKGTYEQYLLAKEQGKVDFFSYNEQKEKVLEPVRPKHEKPKQNIDKILDKKIKTLEREINSLDMQITECDDKMIEYALDFEKLTEISNEKAELELLLLEKMEEWDNLQNN